MISVIGAGPAGCYSAYLLAKAGKDVSLFEEHKEIGSPVQCTGLVTSPINNILKLKKGIIINEIDKVKIFSSEKNFLGLKLKDKNLILDRKKFDSHLADLAVSMGAKIFLNYKFISCEKNIIKIRYNNEKEAAIRTDNLIGADGPLSQVAKLSGMIKQRKFLTGIQATAKLKNDNCIEFYPSIGAFAWVVPENSETCRVGVASYNNPKDDFTGLLKLKKISSKDIIEKQGGLIPVYDPRLKTKKDNIYLVGDAAAQVKATTGGGIIQSLKAAQALADSIINNRDYEKEWKKEIGKDLLLHLRMRNIMNRFREKDWSRLIKMFKKDRTKRIIESFDRDYPTRFAYKLLLSEPRMLYFLRFLF
ncbi:NAD(P)/FAD-dependent oxidoreductase [Candidatus Woesearchaeota archaeon]|nr:NAD(P)/FAD-dependent oxidoreductase [Candidatus Woesearchaeota archaeon]